MPYETIVQLLEILSKPAGNAPGFPYKTLLDIGCGNGYFVEQMREEGCQAVGIDLAPRRKYKHIVRGDARNLSEYFGKRKFDVITANGVLNSGGLLEALCITDPKIAEAMQNKRSWSQKDIKLLHENALAVLRSCYAQLNSPGLFINSEGNFGEDYLVYSKKEIKEIGFSPFIFRKNIAVLGKN